MQVPDQADDIIRAAYDHFHVALFDATLPPCRVLFHADVDRELGYGPGPRRGGGGSRIVLHRGFFGAARVTTSMQVLVHEMVHHWQFHFGHPAEARSHNAEFARKSISIGLMPSSSGGPGGARTGKAVIDYVMNGGKFARVAPRAQAMWEAVFPLTLEGEIARARRQVDAANAAYRLTTRRGRG